jgi:hypothetical protein
MTRLLCVRLGAGPSSATLVNLHIVRRVALSQANIWSSRSFLDVNCPLLAISTCGTDYGAAVPFDFEG